jgi:hypothetical protein
MLYKISSPLIVLRLSVRTFSAASELCSAARRSAEGTRTTTTGKGGRRMRRKDDPDTKTTRGTTRSSSKMTREAMAKEGAEGQGNDHKGRRQTLRDAAARIMGAKDKRVMSTTGRSR